MISVDIKKSGEKFISLEVSGHAEFANPGKDVVCSAVSVLVINALNSIECLTTDKVGVESEESGYIYASFPVDLSSDSILLLNSLELGLSEIEKKYKKYFKLKIKEV